jgi:hypothetical protein
LGAFYVSDKIISDRARYLITVAESLATEGILAASDGLILRRSRIPLLTRGYFLLNLAFKDWRIPDGHFTEKPKIAALTCVAIQQFEPFIPPDPANTVDLQQCRCNAIYAFACAMGILEKQFSPSNDQQRDLWLRILDIIHDSSAETLAPFIKDIDERVDRPLDQYALEMHPMDMLAVNSLISIFELLSNKTGL